MKKSFRYEDFQYEGEAPLLSRVPNGYGTAYYDCGDRFDGNWEDGKRVGHGVYTTKAGTKYHCYFVNDMPEGEGKIEFSNGTLVGKFHRNWYIDQGTFTFKNGSVYKGPLKKNLFEGEGEITYANGNRYKGNFSGGARKGKGVFFGKPGDKYAIYSEAWTNDGPTGICTYFYLTDKGDISTKITGIIDTKTWLISGFGYATYSNGEYEGNLVNNVRQGKGKYTFKTGEIQDGMWENGKFQG